ncbi:Colicin V production protein [hydrothermal vent metagenome]|uniref:Colicin V production protein n=1 Tax=hydrothermal vent metagenome TaxID=652676 RepID=A0A1W1B916_9ZZZZ
MDLNYFDIVVGSIILLLGLKGIINGLFKEFFGLVGIVGGVFIASRLSESVGKSLSDLIFHFENSAAINFTGFLVVLATFWVAMIAVGHLLKKLSALSGLGIVDRIFGFIFGAGKFFFILSIISYALYNVKTIRINLEKPLKNSILFPIQTAKPAS